jgi:hypothetical protein
MKSLSMITVLSLCLILVAGTAMAEREVNVTLIAQDVQTLNAQKSAAADCALGNTNPIAYAITDWIWGAETYGYVFDADQAGCVCAEGFTVEAAHMFLQFGVEDVPVTFDVFGSFHEAAYDDASASWVPGPVACDTPLYTVTIPSAGLYDISLPTTPGDCPCAYFGYKYAITFTFPNAFDSTPDLITDAIPVGGVSWNDYGGGWLDLLDFGLPGEVSLFADVICCASPVSADSKTFGDLKALYR